MLRSAEERKMKIQSIVKLFTMALFVVAMTGCGEEILDGIGDNEPNSVPGGTANKPAEMSLDLHNVIVKNSYYNYFKYRGEEGEKLEIMAVLENAILPTQRTACQQEGDTYIAVYDSGMHILDGVRTCSKYLSIVFPVDGTYIFQIQYPGNKGYFAAESHKP
jgi:hypothetical protein